MSLANVDQALKTMHHRGPDGYGVWNSADNTVGLGHVRLSIMDLAGGAQPLSDESRSIWAVVNGEFYDFERIRSELVAVGHTFKTHSDSEILIHLYKSKGVECLKSLRGEFSFCLWDSRKSSLFVGRDRFGVKPLFYTHINGRLLIASEMKAFLSLGWEPEWDVDSVMNSKAFFENKTLFRGVYNLEPGHYFTASYDQDMVIKKYWAPEYPDKCTIETRTEQEMIEGVRQRLLDAVRVRMRSDVPVCVYLSGGVDSSTILGMATSVLKETQPDESVHAFTISFSDDDNGKYDESLIAQRSAKHFGAVFHKLSLSQQVMSDAFQEAVWHWEMPMVDFCSVAKFLLSKFVRESGFKVVLVGEGSDEHFSGYEAFHIDYLREVNGASTNAALTESTIAAKLAAIDNDEIPGDWCSEFGCLPLSYKDSKEARSLLNGISTHRVITTMVGYPRDMFTNLAIHSSPEVPDPCMTIARSCASKINPKWHKMHQAMTVWNATFFPELCLLHEGDRSEMANSIEGRLPYLDSDLVEYVNNLPPEVKYRHPTDKWILREASRPYVTDEIYKRKKFAYVAPPAVAKPDGPRSTHVELLRTRLTRSAIDLLGWASWDFVQEMFHKYVNYNDRLAHNNLNALLSMVVIGERFNVKTWKPTTRT